jgi:hypothetical protein
MKRRATLASDSLPCLSVLTATVRPMVRSSALVTSPTPPAPRSSPILYRGPGGCDGDGGRSLRFGGLPGCVSRFLESPGSVE